MMIPKIIFRYSSVYDRRYSGSKHLREKMKEKWIEYPSADEIRNYIKKVEPMWRKVEKSVFSEISKITGLKWNQKEVICYVIGYGRPFSDPLTMNLFDNKNDFIDTLIHEIIHQIQVQNRVVNKEWVKYIAKKYPEESRVTRNHIFIHAIHEKIYLKLFDENRLKHEREIRNREDYIRAWEIVDEQGADNLIKVLRKL